MTTLRRVGKPLDVDSSGIDTNPIPPSGSGATPTKRLPPPLPDRVVLVHSSIALNAASISALGPASEADFSGRIRDIPRPLVLVGAAPKSGTVLGALGLSGGGGGGSDAVLADDAATDAQTEKTDDEAAVAFFKAAGESDDGRLVRLAKLVAEARALEGVVSVLKSKDDAAEAVRRAAEEEAAREKERLKRERMMDAWLHMDSDEEEEEQAADVPPPKPPKKGLQMPKSERIYDLQQELMSVAATIKDTSPLAKLVYHPPPPTPSHKKALSQTKNLHGHAHKAFLTQNSCSTSHSPQHSALPRNILHIYPPCHDETPHLHALEHRLATLEHRIGTHYLKLHDTSKPVVESDSVLGALDRLDHQVAVMTDPSILKQVSGELGDVCGEMKRLIEVRRVQAVQIESMSGGFQWGKVGVAGGGSGSGGSGGLVAEPAAKTATTPAGATAATATGEQPDLPMPSQHMGKRSHVRLNQMSSVVSHESVVNDLKKQTKETETERRVNYLYGKVNGMDSLISQLPYLIYRLHGLRGVHETAHELSDRLNNLVSEQMKGLDGVRGVESLVRVVEEGLKANTVSIDRNFEQLELRVLELFQRLMQ
ncbi:hypothetical protein BCR33DRAFT_711319 [Rhizoclosmatium globosum]|uniref:Uncharacterized protein n=1 Tax=Rhizoclosmatium globosum TaxID=329046 RepID=A0A1Y2D0V0_9FUNG|nr:hypothetical protein BCR33DRAFT_711319 [Rhizoclosmatium globosum]|eukprot:ORY52902.1 hypothetical protein BCR33DRAFT_711319 [Rhizoclosmatium globosum]